MFPHKRTSNVKFISLALCFYTNLSENYFIGIMFLHKFDILNRNLNGLFQKFKPVVTKLFAVTKLGDLTVPIREGHVAPGQLSVATSLP